MATERLARPVMLTTSEADLILEAIDEYAAAHDDRLVLAMVAAAKIERAARKAPSGR